MELPGYDIIAIAAHDRSAIIFDMNGLFIQLCNDLKSPLLVHVRLPFVIICMEHC